MAAGELDTEGIARASARASVVARAATPSPDVAVPLFNEPRPDGRAAQRALADQMLADVVAGQGNVLTICGEPGIGKTWVVNAIVERAEASGIRVIRATALAAERHVPYGFVVDALDDAIAGLDAQAPTQFTRHRLHRAVAKWLERNASEGPVLLALDDMHWADAASCQLIAHLLYRWPAGVLGVLAYRPTQALSALRSACALVAKERRLVQLDLAPLTFAETEAVLGPETTPMVRRSLYRLSGGNPFYLRELAEAGGDAKVPQAIRDQVNDELATLPYSVRLLLEGAAVAGEPFDVSVAAAVAGIHEADVPSLLDHSMARNLVRRPDAANPVWSRRRLVFRHPIVGRAIYESTGEGWRTLAHARAADALAQRGAPLAIQADHVERAIEHDDATAAALLEQAGHEAAPRTPTAAARWFAAALRVLPHDADADRRLSLLASLAVALGTSGRTDACREVLDDALTLVAERSSEAGARCVVTAARVHQVVGDRADVRALLETQLRQADAAPWGGDLHAQMSIEHVQALEWESVATHAASAYRSAQRTEDRLLGALAAALMALAEKELAATTSALGHVDEARETVDALTDSQLARGLEVLAYLGQAEHELGQHRHAVHHLQRGLAIARATEQKLFVVPLSVALGFAQVALGQLHEASNTADLTLRVSSALGDERSMARAYLLRCVATMGCGDLESAVQAGHEAVEAANRSRSPRLAAAANCRLGEALIESGAYGEGLARIVDHCGGAQLTWVSAARRPYVYAVLAEAELALGRLDDAKDWVTAAEQHASALALAPATADASRARAALLLAWGDRDASTIAVGAATAYAELGQQVQAAHANTLAGCALALALERDRALERLQHAHATLDACGALRARDRVAYELRALGRRVGRTGRRPHDGADGIASLSPREREIAQLVALGHTNRRIAEELYLGTKTVETHLSHIFEKLGVSSRAQVAAQWAAHAPS